jgi:two-component system sensor histidine kinase/response regulator
VATPDYSVSFAFDADAARRARRLRYRRFQVIEVPRLRVIGFFLNAIGIIVHNKLVLGLLSVDQAFFVTGVLLFYSLAAWALILLIWDRVHVVDVADVFLVFDVVVLGFVVYVSGADRSLLWLVFIARPADQVATTFRRSLFFAHLGPLSYLGLMLYVTQVEHREITWATELAKVLFLYIMSIYIALTARTAEARRNKLADARRVAEHALQQADERRRELEDALMRLESASKAKSEFLANVSHELRTPLNSVLGTCDLLLDSPVTREQREMIGVLRDSAESLTFIVNDILDLARIEARRLPLEQIPMRLRDVAGATVRMFAARAHQKPIELVCHVDRDVPDALLGDPVRLRQVLTNLIGNAVKFTERGDIILRVERDEVRGNRLALKFSVSDTGIGIPKDRQAAIFEAFTQVDGSSTRKYGGTGLGLTIANELVSLMDGRLWVESEPGRGSTFAFTAWFGRTAAADTATPAPWGAGQRSILIADGHAPTRAALEEALAVWPVRIVETASGHAAQTAIAAAVDRHDPFDLAFVDASLPGISGFELAARLRATPDHVKRVVMLLHSGQSAIDAERAVSLGALCLVKPLTPQSLVDTLRAASGSLESPMSLTARAQAAGRSLRILIVDDHVVNQAVASAVLKKWGHAVASASDGAEALEKIAAETHNPYDLVLMDLQMPVLDGLDATRRLRKLEAASGSRRVPVVAMTARALDEDRKKCLDAGMDGYLSKPLDQRALFDIVAQFTPPLVAGDGNDERPAISITPLIADRTLARHVAELFLATAPGQFERLKRALDMGDIVQGRAVAHSLKGASAHFAGASTAAATKIEEFCEDGRLERAIDTLGQLKIDLDALCDRLRAYLATTGS